MAVAWVSQRYRDVSPVSLQVAGGAASSSLYCGEVEGLPAGLVESFLVELYRCKLCQFTCGLKTSISSHLLHRHRPSDLAYLTDGEERGGEEDGEGAGSPYRLDLTGESKQSDEDEDFLLYNMLDSMSPPTCDIGSEGGLQVAHTCEVSTLFEEEEEEEEQDSSIFPLQQSAVDLSCHVDPPATQEEMAQSAHLMTLGLCRISTVKPAPASQPPAPLSADGPRRDGSRAGSPPSGRRRLPCLLCPLTLSSQRLLDVHVRSHRSAGGFGCVRCGWTADSWEELEPHWRSHCRRRGKKKKRRKRQGQEQQQQQQQQQEEKKKKRRRKTAPASRSTLGNVTSQNTHQQTDRWREQLIGQADPKKTSRRDSPDSRSQTVTPEDVSETRTKIKCEEVEDEEDERTSAETRDQAGFSCSLCHRTFSSKLTLKRHRGVHGGEKPHRCPHCSYSSRLKASLLQHLRTHTGEKPYRCAQCPYASIDRSSLLRHSRTHSQEKPYRCQHCDYSSIQKKSLDLHARRHHTGEAFPCQRCEYSSPDRQLLLRHIRRHHKQAAL
ncbi:zinc finger protein 354B [Salarias fasciatus]|uniref:Zinc finger protein 354B-like n=1 Tax=Salarias fasciatus TaxID=181472 RepID=A0A672FLA9_SALFA|nr:zinc finger protein 354B-like [Salarias fasciatus]